MKVPWFWRRKKGADGLLGYGIDDPVTVMSLVAGGACSGAAALASDFLVRPRFSALGLVLVLVCGIFAFAFVALAAFLVFTSAVARAKGIKYLLRDVPLGGEELLIDFRCGRGQLAVAAAKELNFGMVVCVDTWNPWHLTGNAPASLIANARREMVDDRVSAVEGDPSVIPFLDGTFDAAVSSFGLSHLRRKRELDDSAREVVRVLKDGGRLSILATRLNKEYPKTLASLGMTDIKVGRVRYGVLPVAERLVARKHYAKGKR